MFIKDHFNRGDGVCYEEMKGIWMEQKQSGKNSRLGRQHDQKFKNVSDTVISDGELVLFVLFNTGEIS